MRRALRRLPAELKGYLSANPSDAIGLNPQTVKYEVFSVSGLQATQSKDLRLDMCATHEAYLKVGDLAQAL
jgi:hypothetical protein